LEVCIVREAELAVDGQTAQRGRADVEHHLLVSCNDDLLACDGHLAVWPASRIRPERLADRLRSSFLGSKYADHEERRKERSREKGAMLSAHEIDPRIGIMILNLAKISAFVRSLARFSRLAHLQGVEHARPIEKPRRFPAGPLAQTTGCSLTADLE